MGAQNYFLPLNTSKMVEMEIFFSPDLVFLKDKCQTKTFPNRLILRGAGVRGKCPARCSHVTTSLIT